MIPRRTYVHRRTVSTVFGSPAPRAAAPAGGRVGPDDPPVLAAFVCKRRREIAAPDPAVHWHTYDGRLCRRLASDGWIDRGQRTYYPLLGSWPSLLAVAISISIIACHEEDYC